MDGIAAVVGSTYGGLFLALFALAILGRLMDLTFTAVRRDKTLPQWMHEVVSWIDVCASTLQYGAVGASLMVAFVLFYRWTDNSLMMAIYLTLVTAGVVGFLTLLFGLALVYSKRGVLAIGRRWSERRTA